MPHYFYKTSLTHSIVAKSEYDESGPSIVHRKCF